MHTQHRIAGVCYRFAHDAFVKRMRVARWEVCVFPTECARVFNRLLDLLGGYEKLFWDVSIV